MTADELRELAAPDGLPPLLSALWHDARGDWERAHELAQSEDSARGTHVHGYLHRKEGDEANARYWYARAGTPFPTATFDEEWAALVETILAIA